MARTGRPKAVLEVTADERVDLERYARGRTTAQALAFRARIVLLCASGKTNTQVAREVKADLGVVGKWRKRFIKDRVAGLADLPRPNVHRKLDDERVEEVVRRTLETTPKGATHWSSRKMAKQAAVSQSSVSRIWRAFQLKPHRTRTFTLSTDPFFTEKVRDVVGLYMNPPDNAVVLCVDEKSAVQALERTQPVLPLVFGQSSRATATYKRHGVTNLFAALNVATGKVIGACFPDKRAVEFRRFLNDIDAEVPAESAVHVIVDNSSIHNAPEIKRWLKRHPRFHMHFTPTYSSWLNLVERWFSNLTEQALRRGSHKSTTELKQAIDAYLEATNDAPKPFIWTKTADPILASVARFCARTIAQHTS
jgi:transposase